MASYDEVKERYPTYEAFNQRFVDDMGRFDPALHAGHTLYKLRAECSRDVYLGFSALCDARDPHASTKMCEAGHYCIKDDPRFQGHDYMPDVDVVFASTLSLNELRAFWSAKEDLHVMVETVAKLEDYTGDRVDYDVDTPA